MGAKKKKKKKKPKRKEKRTKTPPQKKQGREGGEILETWFWDPVLPVLLIQDLVQPITHRSQTCDSILLESGILWDVDQDLVWFTDVVK